MEELAKILLKLESEGAVEVANNYIKFQYFKIFLLLYLSDISLWE